MNDHGVLWDWGMKKWVSSLQRGQTRRRQTATVTKYQRGVLAKNPACLK